ncbi:MAG: sugar ABC transporter permease [Clostridia bacterium]|jgi:cellobiose transport system permease protein|nr:sugar ABC transporter permease [Clostridia bacterium]NLS85101.1 sugar ABC transporter permease [Oscillospiraceae bacterium]
MAKAATKAPAQSLARRHKSISYSKWGYIFLAPFFIVYGVFSLYPLLSTFYNSFFECYRSGLKQIGPNFVGLQNYLTLFSGGDLLVYAKNTLILWIMGFVPQIIVSLLLAAWFTDLRLKLRCTPFFKTVIYLPNLIMAASFAMLFFALFSDLGPVNRILIDMGLMDAANPYKWLGNTLGTRSLVALMNFLMWYGNTTILLMAAVLGIDPGLYEAAEIDGASSTQQFFKITIPLIKPILIYVVITSMIGGIQMFDVPQILTNGVGTPDRTSMTLVMFLNKHLYSKNYGLGGALSVILFAIAAILSIFVFKFNTREDK